MRRRQFLEGCAAGLASLIAARDGRSVSGSTWRANEIRADIAIIGGGLGGCAAALAALRAGRTVVLTEQTDWIGGQCTQQAVAPLDEHPWIEQFGANASYRRFRAGIRDYYRAHYPLTAEAAADLRLNPGRGGVSALCAEPRVALAALSNLLTPYASAGRLLILLEHHVVRADVQGDRVGPVTVRDQSSGAERTIIAPYLLDATELGDLLPLAGVEFVTGFEARADTGEARAPEAAQPDNQQSFTCCFAMDYIEGEDHTLEKPAEYAFWRDYVPKLSPPWPGKLFGPTPNPITLKTRPFEFDPTGAGAGFWVYRRIIDPRQFRPGAYAGGITLVNWPMNDYWLGNLVGVSAEEFDKHVARAKQLSLSLLYWLQTEAPRPDGGAGWKGLRLRPDIVGTTDGLAKYSYIRESRRIRAEFTVVESHVGADARRKALGHDEVMAEPFPDSVGVGSYRIDLHPSSGGDNYIDVSSLPFQIPLGALIPRRVENLLPACKNLGVTHITNGCYRLHPVEWAIGEAAGSLAAFCLESKLSPRAVRNIHKHLDSFQRALKGQGVELEWARLSPR
jgi:hypothetical protein